MHAASSTAQSSSAASLAARERVARRAIWRLRDRSREIERLLASTLGARHDPVAVRARALQTEAARIRADLRLWDARSLRWIERIEARIDRLAAEIRLTAEMNRADEQVPQRLASRRSAA